MARPKRIDLPFSLYHVFSRTVSKEKAFTDLGDQKKFLRYLSEYADLYSFRVHCWCLLPNHFHLLLESGKQAGLSLLMHRLLTAYTVFFNRRHSRHGHLFQGRFKSLIVDKPSYLLSLSRYIHLNPVEAKICTNPEHHKGSSLEYFIKGGEPDYLYTAEILKWFDGDREKYADFIKDGMNEDIKPEILRQRYVGGESFARRTLRRTFIMEKRKKRPEIPRPQPKTKQDFETMARANLILTTVSEHFGISGEMTLNRRRARGESSLARKILIYLLYENLPWTIRRIADFVRVQSRSGIHKHLEEVREKTEMVEICRNLNNKMGLSGHKWRG